MPDETPALDETPAPYDDRLARMLVVPLVAVLAAVVITFFVAYSSFQVVGPSMEPTLLEGDRLLVTRGYTRALRGDVVVIDGAVAGEGETLVKRVVGVPGDTVATRGDLAIVNGVPEKPAGLLIGESTEVSAEFRVPRGTVFVMGDNRIVSLDSRFIGPVPLSRVKGRAVAVFAPVNRLRAVRPTPGG